jgi:hypothetical protein
VEIETISRQEFEELSARLRNLDINTQKKADSWWTALKLGLRWWHIVLAIIVNDILLIVLGASIASAFYQIEPIEDGSFRANNIEVTGLKIDPGSGNVHVQMESFDSQTELALRSAAGERAKLTMSDNDATDEEIFSLLSVLDEGAFTRSLKLKQGTRDRLSIVEDDQFDNETDIMLDPSKRGSVIVKGDLTLDKTRISTLSGPLEFMPPLHSDLRLMPSGNGTVNIMDELVLFDSKVTTRTQDLLLEPVAGRDVVLDPTGNGTVVVDGPLYQGGGNVFLEGNMSLYAMDLDLLHTRENSQFDGDLTVGDSQFDSIDFNGHIKSCGTSAIERYFCDSSKLVFDADDDGVSMILYMPDPDALTVAITFPQETGEVLTTASKNSGLIRVGALEQGSIVNGFGSAEVSTLTSRGASNLFGDTTIGISRDNLLSIKGHFAEEVIVFDVNSDGVRYILRMPDPSANKEDWPCFINSGDVDECVRQGVTESAMIDFPDETGTILTHVSKISQLEEVGPLHKGSLVPGFGSATVTRLTATAASYLGANVKLGQSLADTLEISSRVLNERLVFDANSDGASLSIWFPDPLMSQTIYFPERSGELLTDTSTYSVLTQLGDVFMGSILEGFGAIHGYALKVTTDSYLYDDVQLGDELDDVLDIRGHIVSHEFVFDANSDGTAFTLVFPDPDDTDGNHAIKFPKETGLVLTSVSTRSNLTEVAALSVGTIAPGFGSAVISELEITGDSNLRSNVTLGSTQADRIIIKGSLYVEQLVVNNPSNKELTYSMSFPRTKNPVRIAFPPEKYQGTLLTDTSEYSSLISVAELTAGAIADGFGPIQTTAPIEGQTVTAIGLLKGESGAELGSQPDDVITLRGALEVRGVGSAGTMFSVAPQTGDTFVRGNIRINGAIEALAAPFYVDTIHVSYLTELEEDEGINIEGMIFKDGGFPFAVTDMINEFTEGQGVFVEGVLMKRGAITAQAAHPGMSPVGNADLLTLVNEGRDFQMVDTFSTIKFRQWHQGIPDNTSYATDSAAITVGTESDWRVERETRNAFMGFSTVYKGRMHERVHIDSDGDFHINVKDNIPKFTSYEDTGNAFIYGNVSVGVGYEGVREVLVSSEDREAILRVSSKSHQGQVVIESGNGHASLLTVRASDNAHAIIRLEDPAARTMGGAFDFVLDGTGSRILEDGTVEGTQNMSLVNTRKVYTCVNITETKGVINPYNVTREVCTWETSDPVPIFDIYADSDSGRGNMAVSGELSSWTASIEKLLEAGNLIVHNDAQLGSSIDDRLSLLGHIVSENISVDLESRGENHTLTMQFLPVSSPQHIIIPGDESGQMLTSDSNYSTLRAVAELTHGSIGEGFGHAEVASLGAKGDIQSRGEIIFGDEPGDGVNIAGHFRETQIVFDSNSDFWRTTLQVPDPSPELPPFNRTCATWNDTAVKIFVPWEHDDFRKFKWTDTSISAADAVVYLTDEVLDFTVVPIPSNITDQLFNDSNGNLTRTIEQINCAYDCVFNSTTNETDCVFNNVTSQTLREAMLLYMYTELLPTQLTGVSHTLKFPKDSGAILYRNLQGETHLIGDVFLGEDPGDAIKVPGTVQGDVRVEGHIVGKKLECVNRNLFEGFRSPQECDKVVPSLFRSFPSMTCDDSFAALGVTVEGSIGDWCPIECYPHCHANGSALRFKNKDMEDSGFEITVAVPTYTESHVLTLPANTGDILSSASSFSTLNKLGVLEDLTVNGTVHLNGGYGADIHVGASLGDYHSSVHMDGVIVGLDAMRFAGPTYGTQQIVGCSVWANSCAQTAAVTCTDAVTAGCKSDGAGGFEEACAGLDSSVACLAVDADSNDATQDCAYAVHTGSAGVCLVYENATETNFTAVTFDYTNTGPRANTVGGGVQRLQLPAETGVLISSGSDFQVITGLGEVAYGNLVEGFGAAHVSSLRSSGDARLNGNITIGDDRGDQISWAGSLVGPVVMRLEGLTVDDFGLTMTQPEFTKPRIIGYPDEDGRLLTTTSNVSRLREVGELERGSIVEGFGAAHVGSLAVTAESHLNGAVKIGDGHEDKIEFAGSIASRTIRFDHDGGAGSLSLKIPDPVSESVQITMPSYSGTLILDTTRKTGITGTAALDTGSITEGFGPITVGRSGGISTINKQPIVSSGDLVAEGATIFSHTGVPAGANMEIPGDKSLVRITPGNGENKNYFTLPAGKPGELLVIQNDDDMHAYPLDVGIVEDVPPDDTAVFFHIGYRWVEISRLLQYDLDGSSKGKIPMVSGPKRMTASAGLYWEDESDHLTVKSTNEQAKFSMETVGDCLGYLPHEAACRNNATRYTMQIGGEDLRTYVFAMRGVEISRNLTSFRHWGDTVITDFTCEGVEWSGTKAECLESKGTCAGAVPDVLGTTTKVDCDGPVTMCEGAEWSGTQAECLESKGTCAGADPDMPGTTTKADCDGAATPGTFTSTAIYAAVTSGVFTSTAVYAAIPIPCGSSWNNFTNATGNFSKLEPDDDCYSKRYSVVERELLKMGGVEGFFVSETNVTLVPAKAMAIRDAAGFNDIFSVGTATPGEETVDVHASRITVTAGTFPDQSDETCDPCVCDNDGIVAGVETGNFGCFRHRLFEGSGFSFTSDDGSPGPIRDDYFCMVHADCKTPNGTIDGTPFKFCSAGDEDSDCNTEVAPTNETTVHGDLIVVGSRVSLQRKTVKAMSDGVSSRTSREMVDVIAYDEKGALQLTDKTVDFMVQDSFVISSPLTAFDWNSGRRRMEDANRTVLSLEELGDPGNAVGAMNMATFDLQILNSTTLNTAALTIQTSGVDALVISALGATFTQETAITLVTKEASFRTAQEDGTQVEILSISGTVPGQETISMNAPVLKLDTRIIAQSGHPFGGELLLATLQTVLQTTTSLGDDVPVLTVEDAGKLCDVTFRAMPTRASETLWFTIDFDPTIYGPYPTWVNRQNYDIPLQLAGGQHFIRFFSGTTFGWYGGGGEIIDAYGASISRDEDGGQPALANDGTRRVRSTSEGSRMYFTIGTLGECERVEARFNSEFVGIYNKAGDHAFMTVDMQDPATSQHPEVLTIDAPEIKVGVVGNAVTVGGTTVTFGAGSDPALNGIIASETNGVAKIDVTGAISFTNQTNFVGPISMPAGIKEVEFEAETVMLNSPNGSVVMDGNFAQVIGRHSVQVDAQCRGSMEYEEFEYTDYHCEYASNGNWRNYPTETEASCAAGGHVWVPGFCTETETGVVFERGLSEEQCVGPMGYSGWTTTCEDYGTLILDGNLVHLNADGHKIITLQSGGVGYRSRNAQAGEDATEMKIVSDVTRVRDKADEADILYIDNAGDDSRISINPWKVAIGDSHVTEVYKYDPPHCEYGNGQWGSQTESSCAALSLTWKNEKCTDPGGALVVANAFECAGYNKTVTQTVTVEASTVALGAVRDVEITAPLTQVHSNFRMKGKMGLSYAEREAANEIDLCGGYPTPTSCTATMVAITMETGTQQNRVNLPTNSQGAEIGDTLIIYNNDDDPVATNAGPDIAPGAVGTYMRWAGTDGLGSWVKSNYPFS